MKLSDGKGVGGSGRLTDQYTNYGEAIRKQYGQYLNIELGMMMNQL